jgi:hypothetical protein
MNEDSWRLRSRFMWCMTCMWYVPKHGSEDNCVGLGRCRRHSPIMDGFPVVRKEDWCGDHELDENKIGEVV